MRKTVNGVDHLYTVNGSQILTEEWATGVDESKVEHLLVYLYDANGSPIGMEYRDSTYTEGEYDLYTFQTNMFGDVSSVYNESGALILSYTYNAWGIFIEEETAIATEAELSIARLNPFRYRGYYYDTELGLYYLNARYYDPNTGRFIHPSSESISNSYSANGLNLYSYASNNPINIVYRYSNTCSSTASMAVLGEVINSFDASGGVNYHPNFTNFIKELFVGLGEVGYRAVWGLTRNGRAFLNFHYSAYGIDGYKILDGLPSKSAKVFKGIAISLMFLDVVEAGYDSYQKGHSLGQGILNVGLNTGKNLLVYSISRDVGMAVGIWTTAKLGASLGSAAGPVGFIVGAAAGAIIGWAIDEFCDIIIYFLVE